MTTLCLFIVGYPWLICFYDLRLIYDWCIFKSPLVFLMQSRIHNHYSTTPNTFCFLVFKRIQPVLRSYPKSLVLYFIIRLCFTFRVTFYSFFFVNSSYFDWFAGKVACIQEALFSSSPQIQVTNIPIIAERQK